MLREVSWICVLIWMVFGSVSSQDVDFGRVFGDPPPNSTTTTPRPVQISGVNVIPVDDDGFPTCECVPYYQCDINNTIIENGKGIFNIRAGNSNPCMGSVELCCSRKDKKENIVKPKPRRRPIGQCGVRNSEGIEMRILGPNNEARFGEFPWMIGVLRDNGNGQVPYKCGGSLINERVVLTGAHCVLDKNGNEEKLVARAGEWDTQTEQEILPYQQRNVQQIIVHENFVPEVLFNNVALLILDAPFDFHSHIDTVCLPRQNDVVIDPNCFVTGWGQDSFDSKGFQLVLKKIQVPIVASPPCQKALRTTALGKYFTLDPSFICAGGVQGQDACTGDGGSPLVCPIPGQEGRYQQVGIVSWGLECGLENIPGVYTHVALFKDWIDNKLRNLNITTEYNY